MLTLPFFAQTLLCLSYCLTNLPNCLIFSCTSSLQFYSYLLAISVSYWKWFTFSTSIYHLIKSKSSFWIIYLRASLLRPYKQWQQWKHHASLSLPYCIFQPNILSIPNYHIRPVILTGTFYWSSKFYTKSESLTRSFCTNAQNTRFLFAFLSYDKWLIYAATLSFKPVLGIHAKAINPLSFISYHLNNAHYKTLLITLNKLYFCWCWNPSPFLLQVWCIHSTWLCTYI